MSASLSLVPHLLSEPPVPSLPFRTSRSAPPLPTKSVESKLFELLEHTFEPCENRVMPDLLTAIADLESACTAMVSDDSDISLLTDDSLMHAQRRLAMGRRHVEASEARVAGEVARRSRRELGYGGLAQRLGARTPEALVQQLTGSTGVEARRLVRVGTLVATLSSLDLDEGLVPWLSGAGLGVAAGTLSVEAFDTIRVGLGEPTEDVSTDDLAGAARTLVAESATVNLDALAARARDLRNDLDAAGIGLREHERRVRRYLRLVVQSDGMTRITGLLDPESAAIVVAAVDAVTSPRRGGPRFVAPDEVARAARLVADDRTTEQIALDALVEMITIATRANSSKLFGRTRPAVRVLVTLKDLENRTGGGYLEGQADRVSIATVERHACGGGTLPILFDGAGKALNLGRERRLFTARQRDVIAARDGGCLGPDCDRPPSWSEVHHINEFQHGGLTNVDDGVLLCRYHHLLLHNNGWNIRRVGSEYCLVPPPKNGVEQQPIALKSRSGAYQRMRVAS